MAELPICVRMNGSTFDTDEAEYQRENTEVSKKGAVDQYYKLAMPFNGADGSTTFSDLINSSRTFSVGAGTPQISTDQSKFGGASGDFLTTDSSIYPDTNSDLVIGTNDFTIECFIRLSTVSVETCIIDFRPASTQGNYIKFTIISGRLRLFTGATTRIVGSDTMSTNTWHHVCLERVSTTTTIYLDGESQGSYTDSTDYLTGTNRPLIAMSGFAVNQPLKGYMDSLRISIGVARYNGSFTPPTAELTAFPETTIITHPQVSSGQNATVWKFSTFTTIDNPNGESGTIKYQWAVSNDAIPTYQADDTAYNGTWLTLAQLQEVANQTGANLRIARQLGGTTSQDATATDGCITADVPTGGGSRPTVFFG